MKFWNWGPETILNSSPSSQIFSLKNHSILFMSMTTTFLSKITPSYSWVWQLLRSDLEANAVIERKREEARMERELAREDHFNYYNLVKGTLSCDLLYLLSNFFPYEQAKPVLQNFGFHKKVHNHLLWCQRNQQLSWNMVKFCFGKRNKAIQI